MQNTNFHARSGLYIINEFFDADLCSKLRSEARAAPTYTASVVKNGVTMVDERTRKTRIAKISALTIGTLEARLTAIIPTLENEFDIALSRTHSTQVLVYKRGDYFKAHQDNIDGPEIPFSQRKRKITAVIFLNSQTRRPAEGFFCGGTLTFYNLEENTTRDNCRIPLIGNEGLLVAFRSNTFHEVTPINFGERFTLVSWFA